MKLKKPIWGEWLVDSYHADPDDIDTVILVLVAYDGSGDCQHYPVTRADWLDLRPTLAEHEVSVTLAASPRSRSVPGCIPGHTANGERAYLTPQGAIGVTPSMHQARAAMRGKGCGHTGNPDELCSECAPWPQTVRYTHHAPTCPYQHGGECKCATNGRWARGKR